MSNQTIGVGVIGINPNNMGSTMTMLHDEPDLRFRIKAVCNKRTELLKPFAKTNNIPFVTGDYKALIDHPEVEVVAIYTPDALHTEHCTAALRAGKHVVCTKPMVTGLDEAKTLVDEVRKADKKFLVGQTMRFDRQFASLQKIFDDGEIGSIIAAEAFYYHDMRPVFEFTPWRLHMPQDFMYGGVTHPVDILRNFLGDVDKVHCFANKSNLVPEYPKNENFMLNLKFKSGVIAQVRGLYGVVEPPEPMMKVVLFGTKGTAKAEFTDNEPGRLDVVYDKFPVKKPMTMHFEPERDQSAYGHGATVIRYMRHFQDCLDNDKEPCPNVVEGAKTCAVAAAAWESVESENSISVFNDF